MGNKTTQPSSKSSRIKPAKAKKIPEPEVVPDVTDESQSESEEDPLDDAQADADEALDDSNDIDDAEDEEESDDDENGGVNEEGMQRLMKALGDNPLDEYGQAQLRALAGEDVSDDGKENDVSGSEQDEANDVSSGDEEDEEAQEDEGEDIQEDQQEGDDDDETEEEAIPLDEVVDIDQDAVPTQKIEVDDQVAMRKIREDMQLDSSLPWTETLVLSYPESIDVDVDDDLNRELAFYKQALHSTEAARSLASNHNLPFTRPSDYFAEMVKSDAHMERIRQRLLNETASIKKSQDKRKEREGKKYGKQLQLEKAKERERSKKDMEERLKGLKRKRKDVLDKGQGGGDDDGFDIAVEDAINDRPAKRARGGKPGGMPRQARDKKFGFGGPGRRSKQNTRESTDAFVTSSSKKGGAGKGGRHKSKRLGKSRRMSQKHKN